MTEVAKRGTPLPVRLSSHEIGELRADGSFAWASGWERLAPLNARVLSCSIPFGAVGVDPAPFFGGLLPEGIGLERLAREAGVASNDLYGLLAEVGADVGGSVTVGEPRPPLPPIEIAEEAYEAILDRAYGYLRGAAVGGGGSSATGIQAKVALTRDPASCRWLIGRGSTPSTHILKPVSREYGDRLRSEAALNELAKALGLSGHDAWVEPAGAREVLIVERYDRRTDGTVNGITRLHQEDAAQALGLPWGGNDKYEHVNPRASLANIAKLLGPRAQLFATGPTEQERLLSLVTLNVLVGNTDAHAKNYSLLLPGLAPERGTARVAAPKLADAYDLVPQTFFAATPDPLAMRVSGASRAAAVTVTDLVAEGESWGIDPGAANATVEAVLRAASTTVSRDGLGHGAPGRLAEFLLEQADNLLRGDPSWTRSLPPGVALRL